MDFSNLKSQVMAMSLIKSGSSSQNNSELWYLIAAILIISGAEFVFKQFSGLGAKVLERWIPKISVAQEPLVRLIADAQDSFTVTLLRRYDEDRNNQLLNENVEKVDAVIEYLSNLEATQHILLDQRYTIGTDCDISVSEDLKARVKQDPKGAWIEIVLFSDSLKVTDIRAWIDKVHEDYIYEKSNRLGHKTFYFNEIPNEPPRDTTFIREEGADPSEIRWRFDSAAKQLTFTMNEFCTSKSFSNVYGAHVDELRERLNIFINHPEWYEERGIPHTLGVMLHGIPGAGKTSTIKAIAKDTGRHIFNLALRPYTTCKQLTNLFYDENVAVTASDGSAINYRIPLNKRIYVIEDIDCLTDVVLDRTGNHSKKQNHNEVLTLSYLLNLLDGVLETPGRILVITSNFPERIDKALIRPGRIDVKVEFRRADRQFILDMLNHFYECSKALADIPAVVADKFTPAEVMETMCMHFKDPDGALEALIQRAGVIASGTSLDDLMALSDSDTASTVSQYMRVAPEPTTPKPTITVGEVDLTGSKECPWAAQRLYKTVPAASFHEQFDEPVMVFNEVETLIRKELKFGDCMRLLSSIDQFESHLTREQLIAKYGEDNIKEVEKMRQQSNDCMQRMTNEIVEEPEAANAAPDEDLYVNYNQDFPVLEHPPEVQAHFDQLFATLAADPETKALKEKVDAEAKGIVVHDAILWNKMIEEFTAKAEIKSKRSPLELYFQSNVEGLETEAKTAAKIKAFDIQKEADARLQTNDTLDHARIVADRKARKDAKQARKASKMAADQ